ncbi:SsrA-binding protein [Candidatus Dojkabacteria bacterium]|nr:SsrA-binding protein [Candidatus Dojkabacteria bacterium]
MIISNKGVTKHYEVIDKYEAGIMLTGPEVKSIRNKSISFKGTYITNRTGELFLVGLNIGQYKYTGSKNAISERQIKLLVTKHELVKINSKLKDGSITLVPLSIFTKGKRLKLEFAMGRGLKKYDIKSREKAIDQERKTEAREAKYKKING